MYPIIAHILSSLGGFAPVKRVAFKNPFQRSLEVKMLSEIGQRR
jgi:hypothetical protein